MTTQKPLFHKVFLEAYQSRGFIALTSVLILSAILVVLMFTLSNSTYYARFDALSSENKRESLALAESCVNVALLTLANSPKPSADYPNPTNTVNRTVTVGTDEHGQPITCVIQTIGKSGSTYTIDVQASFNGAFSNVTARALVPDPSVGTLVAPPTCALSASPTSIPSGQNVLLQWGTSPTTASFSLDHGIGIVTPTDTGSRSITTSAPGTYTYRGTATGPGGSVECAATFTVTAPPPNPSCADTMMIFDRSGSITAQDRTNEYTAASQLIDLYDGVHTKYPTLFPKIGAGFFGARDGSGAEVPYPPNDGHLSTGYTALKTTIQNVLNDPNGRSGSNLGAGIKVGYDELYGGAGITPGAKKVLIFVSDGEPNRSTTDGTCPMTDSTQSLLCRADVAKLNGIDIFSVQYTHQTNATIAATARALLAQVATGTIPYAGHTKGADDNSNALTSTGLLLPTGTTTGGTWTTPGNVFATDGSFATDGTVGHAQGFNKFNFGVTAGAVIGGIEIEVNGKTIGGSSSVPSATLYPTGQGTQTGWTNGYTTVDENPPFSCSSGDYITSAGTGTQESVTINLSSIPNGSTITSIDVITSDRPDTTAGGTYKSFARIGGSTTNGASDLVSGSVGFGSCNAAKTQNIDVPDIVKDGSTTLEVGVLKTGTNTNAVRVGAIQAVVRYIPTASSCTVDVDLSWNNGSGTSWTTGAGVGVKTVTLTSTQAPVIVGSTADKWGRSSWNDTDFGNGTFVVRVTNKTCGGQTAAIDSIRANITYTGFNPAVENADGDAFFITPDTSTPDAIKNIFDTIGRTVCKAAAAQCGNGIDDDGDGLIDAADPMCHTGGNSANPYDATLSDEYEHPAPPAPPTAPPPPPPINLGSWEEIPQ